jgi:bifunctional DNase/RNase
MSLVDILGIHLETATGTPVVLLREHDAPHRYLPIFVGPVEATAIALAVAGQEPPRPLTHDLMATLVTGLGGDLDAVEITAVHDGTFHARLDLHGPAGPQSIDTRPSDAIALALRLGTPVYVDDAVLDAAGTLLDDTQEDEPLSDDEIDEEVESFRVLLDLLDPTDFDDPDRRDRPDDRDGPDETDQPGGRA